MVDQRKGTILNIFHSDTFRLQMYKGVKHLRVLVAGGDGSVGWVLTYVDKLALDPLPAVSIRI